MTENKNTGKTYTTGTETIQGRETRAPYSHGQQGRTMVRLANGMVISYETYMQDPRGWNGID